jgi:hypothetical protein
MPQLTLQGAFTSGELSPSLQARVDLAKYQQGCRTLRNFLVQPHGGAVKRPGFELIDTLPGEAFLVEFVFNSEQAYCLCFGEKWLEVAVSDGFVLNADGSRFHVASPYTLAQAKLLSAAQSADVLFLACWGIAPQKLMRYGHADWRFEAMDFTAPMSSPNAPSVNFINDAKKSDGSDSPAQLTAQYSYFVTAVNGDDKESELSDPANITGPAVNNWQGGDYISLVWTPVAGAIEYRIYKSSFGATPGYIITTTNTNYNDYNIEPALDEGAPKYEDPFPNGDYPGTVCLFEQRLVFASTPKRPQTIWMSKSGDYSNFAKYKPIADDSPIELTLASSEVSSMSWIAYLRSLILGSSSMEWEIDTAQQGAFSAKNAKAVPQSYRGSAKMRPLIVGNTLLHVSRSRAQVRSLQYDFGSDSYGGTDQTILAAHFFQEYTIRDWTYQQSPDSIVWAVREDGALLGLTFQAEHEVFAWHRHDTQGRFISVCSVPAGAHDALFTVVERGGVFFLEHMAPRYIGGDPSHAVFLDCSLTYEGPPITELTGLDHLDGLVVGVYANGAVFTSRTVVKGKIILEQPAGLVTVGLMYTAELETMPVEVVGRDGTSVGLQKQINSVNILFHNTVGAEVGLNMARWEIVKWRSNEPYGSAPAPFSGIKSITLARLSELQRTVCVRSTDPTPCTILAVMARMETKP